MTADSLRRLADAVTHTGPAYDPNAAAIERVRALHQPFPGPVTGQQYCRGCCDVGGYANYYPCPTIQAIEEQQ